MLSVLIVFGESDRANRHETVHAISLASKVNPRMQVTGQAEKHCAGLCRWRLESNSDSHLRKFLVHLRQSTLLEAPTKVMGGTHVTSQTKCGKRREMLLGGRCCPINCKTEKGQVVTKAGGISTKGLRWYRETLGWRSKDFAVL